ncbi:hypothetical protein DHEL01_v206796 [Diaporthe helianthi]|uniref:Uncharacterized protein n=1 Tax=Diaporthe helianthi TaxID=158607 RepID=A0A2P5HX33_DIAHE|nr:hypothetical protein DHEL01_v206796 [Diaporthe helianthi]
MECSLCKRRGSLWQTRNGFGTINGSSGLRNVVVSPAKNTAATAQPSRIDNGNRYASSGPRISSASSLRHESAATESAAKEATFPQAISRGSNSQEASKNNRCDADGQGQEFADGGHTRNDGCDAGAVKIDNSSEGEEDSDEGLEEDDDDDDWEEHVD